MSGFAHIDEAAIRQAIAAEPLLSDLTEEQRALMTHLLDVLVEGQSRMNLTAIRQPVDMVRYHLADSVALARAMDRFPAGRGVAQAADVGTGGGFPLLPMSILLPHTQWIGIESVAKKARFVEEAGQKLGLRNVRSIAARAEDVGRSVHRETFDLVTSRAVGPVASLLEVEMPLIKVSGYLYMMKTEATRPEWESSGGVLERLGGRQAGEYEYRLEGDEQSRVIFVAEKVRETGTEYPRAAGVPFKKPLVKWEETVQ